MMKALRCFCLVLAVVVFGGAMADAATITVDTANDVGTADGFCSLREAILSANNDVAENDCPAGDGADLIYFDLPLSTTILLLADLPTITESVLIRGRGANELAIDGGYAHRIFAFDTVNYGWFGVEGVTLTNGLAAALPYGGAAYVAPGEVALFRRVNFVSNVASVGGGGLAVFGGSPHPTSATIEDCFFSDNVSNGAIGGGGLAVSGDNSHVKVIRSTFYGNDASFGGAITNRGSRMDVVASTFSNNSATNNGGAIYLYMNDPGTDPLEVAVTNSTITDNQAESGGGGLYLNASAGDTVELTLTNTVVAGNSDLASVGASPDLRFGSGTFLAASGFSFIGDNSGCEGEFPAGSPNAGGDYVGTSGAPLDPLLQPLSFHGGGTPVHQPETAPMSPLVDSGACPGAVTDQRRYGNALTSQRPVDVPEAVNAAGSDTCDIGAVEVYAEPNTDPHVFSDGFESGSRLFWE